MHSPSLAVSRPAPTTPRWVVRGRLALVMLGGASLLTGLNAALIRLEVWSPVASERAGDVHGLVMVYGFLGTLISLERAQSLGRSWGYLAPALYGAGALALVTPAPVLLGQLLLIEAGLLFTAVYVGLWLRAPRPLVAVQVLSAVLALGGAVVAARFDAPTALPWMAAFVLVTIAAERAELAHLTMGPRADTTLLGLASFLTLTVLASLALPAVQARPVGLAVLALAVWLLIHDVVRHQLRLTGQRRFMASALLAGYLNLILAGTVLTVRGLTADVGSYDVVVHAVFLGFAVSMVMAHAPVILPAVLGRQLPYHPVLWVPLVALQAGLVVRFTGALAGADVLWRVGGIATVVSMLLFVATAATLAVRQ